MAQLTSRGAQKQSPETGDWQEKQHSNLSSSGSYRRCQLASPTISSAAVPVLVLLVELPFISLCVSSGPVSEGVTWPAHGSDPVPQVCSLQEPDVGLSAESLGSVYSELQVSVPEATWGTPCRCSRPSSPFPVVLAAPGELGQFLEAGEVKCC